MKTKILILVGILGIITVSVLVYWFFFMQKIPLNLFNKTQSTQTQQDKREVIKGTAPTSIQIINSRNKASEGAQTLQESLNQIEEKIKKENLAK